MPDEADIVVRDLRRRAADHALRVRAVGCAAESRLTRFRSLRSLRCIEPFSRDPPMTKQHPQFGLVALCLGSTTMAMILTTAGDVARRPPPANVFRAARALPKVGQPGDESVEALDAGEQYAQARTAPGLVLPGAYSAAFASLSSLPVTSGTWAEVTNRPYDSDDPRYRDPFFSNSSGGAGLVSGRVTGLAAGGGFLYASGADAAHSGPATAAPPGRRSPTGCRRCRSAPSASRRTARCGWRPAKAIPAPPPTSARASTVLRSPGAECSRPPIAWAARSSRAPSSTG